MKPFRKTANVKKTAATETITRSRATLAWQAAVAALFALLIMQSLFNFAAGLLLGVAILPGMFVFGLLYQRKTQINLPGKGLLLVGLLLSLGMLAGLTWVHLDPASHPGAPVIFGFNVVFIATMTALGAVAARAFNRLDRSTEN